jgi:anti-sigma B factor antagonist
VALADNLQIRAALVGRVALIAASGELDIDTAPGLRTAVESCLPRRPRALEIDLSGVTFCGCEGLNVLLWARCQAAAGGIGFRVLAPRPQPSRLFHLTGTAVTLGLAFPPACSRAV